MKIHDRKNSSLCTDRSKYYWTQGARNHSSSKFNWYVVKYKSDSTLSSKKLHNKINIYLPKLLVNALMHIKIL